MFKAKDLREKNIKIKALEIVCALGLVYQDSKKDLKTANRIIEGMYKSCHISLGDCVDKHENWYKQFDILYESLRGTYIND